jgi:DNA-binding MarR family transcriptional regulator
VKEHLPINEYKKLQVVITRCTKSLEKKGLIDRKQLSEERVRWNRKYAFVLTDAGRRIAKELLRDRAINGVRDVY